MSNQTPKSGDALNIYRLLRIARGLEVKQVAEVLLVQPAYINMIEQGKRTPSERLLVSYARVLEVDVDVIRDFTPSDRKLNRHEHTLLALLKLICND